MRRSGRQIARYLANNTPDAACHRLGHWWAEQEANHRAATSDATAAAAAEPALRLCARCPLLAACADWATTFAYTGLAAAPPTATGGQRTLTRTLNRSRRCG